MSTTDSNENSVILALIKQNFALQNGLVEVIQARDAHEAEYRANSQILAQKDSERLADEAKAQEDYYKSLVSTLAPILIPLVQSLVSPGPQVEENAAEFFGIDPNPDSEQH
jgi:hypothetical protein